jgi:outer membrane protein assembly factor BamB
MLFLAGIMGEYFAKGRAWVLPAFLLPLAAGMYIVDYETYPMSQHIEWPGATTSPNAWVNALLWIRQNTPTDAVFAVDSDYFNAPGVDVHGFRSTSERAALADYHKDGGVVAMFPNLADDWKQQSSATHGLNQFTAQDFTRLAHEYPVTWTAIHGAAPAGMDCPYQQGGYAVCKIPDAPGLTASSATGAE